ncbi:LysR family transcriptional regulator [Sphingobium sp. AM]|nr:LysR family transcriptional regulator [Sphingobium sp. AM]
MQNSHANFSSEPKPRRSQIPANQTREIEALRTFRLLWLETFVAVAFNGSITAAGKALGLNQSNATRQIQALEKWLGQKLLVRTKPVELTPVGEDFVAIAHNLLDSLADARARRKALPTDPDYIPVCQRQFEYDDSEIDPSLPKEIRQRIAARMWSF